MNWHETIVSIRNKSEFSELVRLAYLNEDLKQNVEQFGNSEEFEETLNYLKKYAPKGTSILDIGAGNGISSVCFALKGYDVTAVEPDPSNSVGANAIRELKDIYQLPNLMVYENFAEDIKFENEKFDIVYVRQAMHHAYNLKKFISECSRVLKSGGILFTVRDHVIYDEKDKELFLKVHPLHKFYGGENAFLAQEYREAMNEAGLNILLELKHYDSVINHFPISTIELKKVESDIEESMRLSLQRKIGVLSKSALYI